MRVRLSPRRRTREERGAVAIIFSVLVVMLLVLAAFVTDFGMAYVNKRQSQTAADAAVLAAAKVYSTQPGNCATLVTDTALRTQALDAANTLRAQNLPGSRGVNFDVACSVKGELQVAYEVEADSDIVLGQLAVDADHMIVEREATATFDRPVRGEGGMRPWPMCSNSVPADWATNKVVTQVVGGVKENVGCPGMDMAGDWGRFACPGYTGGNTSNSNNPASSLYWIRNGCPNPASPVPNQQPVEADPAALWSYLTTYPDCQPSALVSNASNEFCLTRDTGMAENNPHMLGAWNDVIAEDETFEVPMFCAIPQCSSDAVVLNEPKNIIPIHQMGVVRLCGVYLNGNESEWSENPACQNANDPSDYEDNMAPPGADSAFYLIYEGFVKRTDTATTGGGSNLRLTE